MHVHDQPDFQFCPVCGCRLRSSKLKHNEPHRLICPGCDFIFYQDPKLVASSVVELDNGIVLLKRDIEPAMGKWVIPGGFVDQGERVEDAALRETEEECGLKTRIKNLLGVYSYTGRLVVVVVYVVERVSGDLIAGDETQEAQLCRLNEIPWNKLAFPSTEDALRDYCSLRSVR